MTLSAEEFQHRFVQHVLPKGFVKVRHYGLLAAHGQDERLALCRRLLRAATAPIPPADSDVGVATVTAAYEPRCPQCRGHRLVARQLPRAAPARGLRPHGDSP
jgi:hypothetical protein